MSSISLNDLTAWLAGQRQEIAKWARVVKESGAKAE